MSRSILSRRAMLRAGRFGEDGTKHCVKQAVREERSIRCRVRQPTDPDTIPIAIKERPVHPLPRIAR